MSGLIRRRGELDFGAEHLAGTLHRRRIEGRDRAAFLQQRLDKEQRWRFTNIIGSAFERQTKYCKSLPAKRPQGMVNLAQEALPLVLVDAHDFVQKRKVIPASASSGPEPQNFLGEAGPAVTDSGIQKSPANAGVGSHAVDYLIHVRTHRLTHGRYRV